MRTYRGPAWYPLNRPHAGLTEGLHRLLELFTRDHSIIVNIHAAEEILEESPLNPKPETLNPKPETLNPKP